MRDFDKETFVTQLNELGDTGADRWAEIAPRLSEPSRAPAGSVRWYRRAPLRVAAVCCAAVILVSGALLWDPLSTVRDGVTPGSSAEMSTTDDSDVLSDSVGSPDDEQYSSTAKQESSAGTLQNTAQPEQHRDSALRWVAVGVGCAVLAAAAVAAVVLVKKRRK